MINKDNYFNQVTRIGESNLPAELREAHSLVSRATDSGKNWDDITPNVNEVIKLQMQKLDDFINSKGKVTTKERKQRSPKKKPSPSQEKKLIKVKRTKVQSTPNKVTKTAHSKKKKKPASKRVKVQKPLKAPVTVKKYSLELQHIKRFAHLHGKDHKIPALESFLKTIEKHVAADDYLNHRSMITEIATRLTKGLEAAKGSQVMAVTIEPSFREKAQDLVANAKVRIRTEFLAGINSERYDVSKIRKIKDQMIDAAIDYQGEDETIYAGTYYNLEDHIEKKDIKAIAKEVSEMPEWFKSLSKKARKEYVEFYNKLTKALGKHAIRRLPPKP